jgi:carbonic anhydrase
MTFPFVRERVEADDLALHGVSIDIRSGDMVQYDPSNQQFVSL